jgi:hypothetical protein
MKKYPLLIVFTILLINLIIVYFGRIYYPYNFSPDKVSFFENFLALTGGLLFVLLLVTCCIGVIYFVGRELIQEIKTLFSK